MSSIAILFLSALAPLLIKQGSAAKIIQLILIPVSYLAFLDFMPETLNIDFVGLSLMPVRVDNLNFLLVSVFHLLAFINVIYGFQSANRYESAASFFYLLSAVGLVLAGDIFSLFVFWELLTIGAVLILLSEGSAPTRQSASRYFLFHVLGGLLFLSGIVGRYYATQDLSLTKLELDAWYNIFILLGIGVNTAFPFLHTWVVDSYPMASPSGTVWLSALTTKTAAYTLIRLFPGENLLIWVGALMMIFPVFYAVIENNLRKVLSYSLINQVGLIVTGIGIGTELGLNGAAAHIVTDIFFKGLLFMSLGAVLFRTGHQKATDLGGLFKSMPLTCTFCIIAAASISAFPLFSGFTSKTLIVAAAAEEHMLILWFALLFASAAVLEHAGIKVPFFTFFGHDSGLRPKEAPCSMLIAMGMTAFLCLVIGIFPSLLYQFLPYQMTYTPYTFSHIVTQMELLLFAGLAFLLMLLAGVYPPEKRGINLDMDFFYRRGLTKIYKFLDDFLNTLNDRADYIIQRRFTKDLGNFINRYPGNLFALFTDNPKKAHASVMDGTVPVAISILFALCIFVLLAW